MNRELQVTALGAIEALVRGSRSQAIWSALFPGVLTGCVRVATGGGLRTGSAVVEAALRVVTVLLPMVVGDEATGVLRSTRAGSGMGSDPAHALASMMANAGLSAVVTETNQDVGTGQTGQGVEPGEQHSSMMPTLNLAWLDETDARTAVLLGRLTSLASSAKPRISLALLDLMTAVWRECFESLPSAGGTVVAVVATCLYADHAEVAAAARGVVAGGVEGAAVGNKPKQDDRAARRRAVQREADRHLNALVPRLRRMLATADDTAKVAILRRLGGLVALLNAFEGDGVGTVVGRHLPQLTGALVHVLTVDVDAAQVAVATIGGSEPHVSPVALGGESPAEVAATSDAQATPTELMGAVLGAFSQYRRRFRFFRDPAVLLEAIHVCRLLGNALPTALRTLDHFLSLVAPSASRDDSEGRDPQTPAGGKRLRGATLEAVLVCNEIVLGVAGAEAVPGRAHGGGNWKPGPSHGSHEDQRQQTLRDAVGMVLDEWLDPRLWRCEQMLGLPAPTDETAILSTLLLDGVSRCWEALALVSLPRRWFLVRVLYPVLEKRGSPNRVVATAALQTLVRMAQPSPAAATVGPPATDLVEALVVSNCDFVTDRLTRAMRHGSELRGALFVLRGLLQSGGAAIFPLLDDAIAAVLGVLDSRDGNLIVPALRVLKDAIWVAAAVGDDAGRATAETSKVGTGLQESTAWKDVEAGHLSPLLLDLLNGARRAWAPSTGGPPPKASMDEIAAYFENKTRSEETDPAVLDAAGGDPAEDAPFVPTHAQRYVLGAVERTSHFVASRQPRVRILAMEVMAAGFSFLGTSIGEREPFLPLVHDNWLPLVHRVRDPVSVRAAAGAIAAIANRCGSFIARRFGDQVWPAVKGQLESGSLADRQQSQSRFEDMRAILGMLRAAVVGSGGKNIGGWTTEFLRLVPSLRTRGGVGEDNDDVGGCSAGDHASALLTLLDEVVTAINDVHGDAVWAANHAARRVQASGGGSLNDNPKPPPDARFCQPE